MTISDKDKLLCKFLASFGKTGQNLIKIWLIFFWSGFGPKMDQILAKISVLIKIANFFAIVRINLAGSSHSPDSARFAYYLLLIIYNYL